MIVKWLLCLMLQQACGKEVGNVAVCTCHHQLSMSTLYFDQAYVLPKSKLSIRFMSRDEKHALQLLPTPLISKQLLPWCQLRVQ